MTLAISKFFYVIARTLAVFGLPGLRGLRSRIYGWNFKARDLSVGDRVMLVSAHPSKQGGLQLGRGVQLSADVYIDYSGGVTIGNDAAVSEGAKIFTHNHVIRTGKSNWHKNPIEFSSLEIGPEVWIGAAAVVLPRVRRIGRGAIIAAGAVLTSDVEDHAVYAGNPAKKIFQRSVSD